MNNQSFTKMNNSYNKSYEHLNQTKDNVVKDIKKLKDDYQMNGGNDPNFMRNLDNLEEFY